MWTHGRRARGTGSHEDLLAGIVRAETALRVGFDASALATYALQLSGARSVWVRLGADGDVGQAGARGWGEPARALIADPAAVRPGLCRRELPSAGVILFGFEEPSATDLTLAAEVAAWAGLRCGEHEAAGETARAARAELRALRAQISPHFLFNAMGAIAALIRTDPARANALLLDFADYTRYSFGRRGEYTSLAEELRSIEIYLSLERARFGERLIVHVTIPPEVLSVAVPFLVLQPLVENAVRHGIEPIPRGGRVTITAEDTGAAVRIVVEDDGAGCEPDVLERLLTVAEPPVTTEREHVGLRNIDERMRAVYGDAYGLIIDTAPGAGTRITLTIPRYRADVHV